MMSKRYWVEKKSENYVKSDSIVFLNSYIIFQVCTGNSAQVNHYKITSERWN